MRAWELRSFGGDGLALAERDEPAPGEHEVAIDVRAAALNSRDLQVAGGHYDPNLPLPIVPLSDAAGVVSAVGPGVSRVQPGDRVAGTFAQGWIAGRRTADVWITLGGHVDGVLQERIVLHEDGVVAVPEHLSDEEAATLPCAAVTAWNALMVRGGLRAGETVLLLGTGGVSTFALQFAVMAGAEAIVVSADAEKTARALELGAAAAIDRRRDPDWDQAVLRITEGRGVDHVLDVVGDLARSAGALAAGGRIALVGYLGSLSLQVDVFALLGKNARVDAITVGPREAFEDMNRALARSGLHPVVDAVHEFEDAPAAFARLSAGAHVGKIVVRV